MSRSSSARSRARRARRSPDPPAGTAAAIDEAPGPDVDDVETGEDTPQAAEPTDLEEPEERRRRQPEPGAAELAGGRRSRDTPRYRATGRTVVTGRRRGAHTEDDTAEPAAAVLADAALSDGRRRISLALVLNRVGRVLIGTGVIILLFVVYQLWGTNIQEQRSQDKLESSFNDTLARLETIDPSVLAALRGQPPATTQPGAPPTARRPDHHPAGGLRAHRSGGRRAGGRDPHPPDRGGATGHRGHERRRPPSRPRPLCRDAAPRPGRQRRHRRAPDDLRRPLQPDRRARLRRRDPGADRPGHGDLPRRPGPLRGDPRPGPGARRRRRQPPHVDLLPSQAVVGQADDRDRQARDPAVPGPALGGRGPGGRRRRLHHHDRGGDREPGRPRAHRHGHDHRRTARGDHHLRRAAGIDDHRSAADRGHHPKPARTPTSPTSTRASPGTAPRCRRPSAGGS